MTRILFATSEAHPLIKTGGLGDVSASLPAALKRLRHAVRVILPAYRQAVRAADRVRRIATLRLADGEEVALLEGRMPDSGVTVWLVDMPRFFDRDGAPYTDPDGRDWPDNADRFAAFARVVVELACDRAGLGWRPEVVHCNDWQTGLVPALLADEPKRPGTLFTIHNLAYQGLFDWETFNRLGLPHKLWSMHALEFHNRMSFIKGGLVFADWITTVSPTYAEEIRTPEFGYGLEGLLAFRGDRLRGILNGVDYETWDPASDPLIPKRYSAASLADKQYNKQALQERLELPVRDDLPLVGMVGRMVEQKGIDLVLAALPRILKQTVQLAIVGSGEQQFEEALRQQAAAQPDRIGLFIGYDEALAHLVEAGSDLFLMPSRFEPCGLNQMYSLRYGTVPVVRRTGGLADTVVHADEAHLNDGTATGFLFAAPAPEALLGALDAALALWNQPTLWRRLQKQGMALDFSWERSARDYLALYKAAQESVNG